MVVCFLLFFWFGSQVLVRYRSLSATLPHHLVVAVKVPLFELVFAASVCIFHVSTKKFILCFASINHSPSLWLHGRFLGVPGFFNYWRRLVRRWCAASENNFVAFCGPVSPVYVPLCLQVLDTAARSQQ